MACRAPHSSTGAKVCLLNVSSSVGSTIRFGVSSSRRILAVANDHNAVCGLALPQMKKLSAIYIYIYTSGPVSSHSTISGTHCSVYFFMLVFFITTYPGGTPGNRALFSGPAITIDVPAALSLTPFGLALLAPLIFPLSLTPPLIPFHLLLCLPPLPLLPQLLLHMLLHCHRTPVPLLSRARARAAACHSGSSKKALIPQAITWPMTSCVSAAMMTWLAG